jgi:hypothetical protein
VATEPRPKQRPLHPGIASDHRATHVQLRAKIVQRLIDRRVEWVVETYSLGGLGAASPKEE